MIEKLSYRPYCGNLMRDCPYIASGLQLGFWWRLVMNGIVISTWLLDLVAIALLPAARKGGA